ncbi:MAG TPA: NADH-quinone oxidoreductase subunit NuoG [Chryseolinea sp.]
MNKEMTLFIDNKPYEVKPGKNLLETCLTLGFDLPYFCWHPALGSVGACRQCAVKVYKDEDDKRGRLIMSCMEPVVDKQRISVQDPEAHEFRDHIIEWLMTNHPHDCAVCDEGGSCHLQDMTVMTGHAYRRYQFKKRTHTNQYLGPFINHEMNRCIQCYRCVRFYKDYAGGDDLDVFASRSNVYFGRHEDGPLESEFSGNLTEVCPTGVFTDKTLKHHYTRKWDLTTAPSICHHCSLGCNTIAGERYGGLRSITSRYNGEVNGYFICDRGRFGYEFVNAPTRLRTPLLNKENATNGKILEETTRILTNANVIGIGSGRASLQSNFALRKLVGDENFYNGESDLENTLIRLVLQILQRGPARTPSLKEVEQFDAILILGEDLTNTAPMLALAVRQSSRQKPLHAQTRVNIPTWNDAAVRELMQDETGPLFIATISATKLDSIATETIHVSPPEIARLGFAIANLIDHNSPAVESLDPQSVTLAQKIANGLLAAKRPLIISGTSCGSEDVLKAAANLSWALTAKNGETGIVLTVPECNSMGLSMMGDQPLSKAFDRAKKGNIDTVLILENDLYRHGRTAQVDAFLASCKNVIVIDHNSTLTTQKANILLPAGTFAESDGILINNEGRAQRFFQVYEPGDSVQESWRWIIEISKALGDKPMSRWQDFDAITQAIEQTVDSLKEIGDVSPPTGYRINGQRIPREPHRFSGRTAMQADVNVSEPKPPVDPDSSLSYTMEGFRGMPPATMTPFYWSPGWNSVQSINKYQQEVGGPLRGGDPGIRLLSPHPSQGVNFFTTAPGPLKGIEGKFLMVYQYHIFGSDELSQHAGGISERSPKAYVMLHAEDARLLNVVENQSLTFDIEDQSYELPLKISADIARGVAAIPYGIHGLPFADLPALATLKIT